MRDFVIDNSRQSRRVSPRHYWYAGTLVRGESAAASRQSAPGSFGAGLKLGLALVLPIWLFAVLLLLR